MTIEKIIARAVRMGRIADGLVLCDNCNNPADKDLSKSLSWTCCGPCATGESDTLDLDNTISVE